MKGLNKLALAVAISAAPFAQAMESLDDSMLGEMTGQAGVTIELDTAVTIASMTYTDTDGKGSGAGSVVMSGIAFGGATVGGSTSSVHDARLDDFKIDIDVDGTNGVIIHLGGTDSKASMLGFNPVDFGLHVDSVTASGVTNNLASDINIAGNLGPIDVTINNTSGSDLINVQAYFEVTSGNLNVDVMGLGINNLKIGQNSMPLLSAGSAYQQEVRNALYQSSVDAAVAGGATPGDAATTYAGLLTADATTLAGTINAFADNQSTSLAAAAITANVNSNIYQTAYDASIAGAVDPANPTAAEITAADTAGNAAVTTDGGATAAGAITADAGATATGIAAVAKAQNANNMAFVSMSIGNGSANYTSLSEGAVAVDNALIVNLDSFNIDVSMDLTMGSTGGIAREIGSIALDDLDMSGTVLKIYGH